MERFSNARIGDKVYSRIKGEGVITAVGTDGVHVCFGEEKLHHYLSGKYFDNDVEPTLFYRSGDNNYLTERPKQKVKKVLHCNVYDNQNNYYYVITHNSKEVAEREGSPNAITIAYPIEIEVEE